MDLGALPPSRYGSPMPAVVDGELGCDVFGGLGRRVAALGITRVWLVTDAGLGATRWIGRAVALLQDAGLVVEVFRDVVPDPSDEDVVAAAARARTFAPDGLVAIGGGSVLDTAKGIAFLLANGGRMEDWWGFGKAPNPLVPIVAVPTTAGTGSEAQSFAVIRRAADGQKMACGAPTARPRLVLLDGRLALTAPHKTTTYAALDAMGHALESAVCSVRTPELTRAASRVFLLLAQTFREVLDRPDDAELRDLMAQAAFQAGACVEAGMLGAAHACANALSARLHVPHGAAVGVMLPRVVRHNMADAEAAAIYRRIGAGLAEDGSWGTQLASSLEEMLEASAIPLDLAAWGVRPELVPSLAEVAGRQWTGTFNPAQPVDWVGLLTP